MIRAMRWAWVLALLPMLRARAEPADGSWINQIEVTATRVPEPVLNVPASVSVISGASLRDRNVNDLAQALALVSGVEAPSGGDAGPASAVPSLLGLHEFDAFLLVVDGVPWGGAYNPAIPTLDLTDVARVEVLKGAAPVDFGATSFVGVIQAIHYPAGEAENRVMLGAGSQGQAIGTLSTALPTIGDYRQSISVEGASRSYDVAREQTAYGRALYRGALDNVAGGTLSLDLSLDVTRATPPSPVPRVGRDLTPLVGVDANYNPADTRINEDQYQGVLRYDRATALGAWQSTASWTLSAISDIRGFLRASLVATDGQNADSQNQLRREQDGYFDTHVTSKLTPALTLLWGADLLYGLGKQDSVNGAYYAPLCGCQPLPATSSLHVDEVNSLSDQRIFAGQYAQADWQPAPSLDLVAGLRMNETDERQSSRHVDGFDTASNLYGNASQTVARPSGMAGIDYKLWPKIALYADYRNSFKPAAIDYGPDFTPSVLAPESADTFELGLKGSTLGGTIEFDIDAFRMNFQNLVVQTTDASGNPLLQNAGSQLLQGVEASVETHIRPDLMLALNSSYHDAHFLHYDATEGGAVVNAAGKALPLAPDWLGSAGLIYSPKNGFFGSSILEYIGPRYLDIANTAPVRGYATLAANAGYRWDRYQLLVSGTNLTDQRPPVTQSEFGDQSYYLLNGRSLLVTLSADL
ncbi:MAG: TonB-dependent receptor [Acidocella sp.]|nr:TonB-dependent receptor [Acidocella sp.]